MPDVVGRDELERELARAISSEQRGQLNVLLDAMGDPPDPAKITEEFWQQYGEGLRSRIEPLLRKAYLSQAQAMLGTVSIGVDWGLVNQAAVDWAQTYAFDLVKNVTANDQSLLRKSVSEYFKQGTIGDLQGKLVGAFGPVRAEMIAVTEVTRSAAAGEQQVVDRIIADNPGIEAVDYWQTNRDDRVCPICGPRHSKARGTNWVDNPPAHPRCRCWVRRDFRRKAQ